MCGIAGIVALHPGAAPPSREALERMTNALRHRGPDDFGLYHDERAGLAHARLSIIDLQTGQQPMAGRDDDGGRSDTWIAFNGEVFNYIELRAELLALGHCFRTRSDTEVLLQAYREWGDAAFGRLNGQWAAAIWDAGKKCLVLARDPLGICPLHLAEHAGHLYFASEVKAIFAADRGIERGFDPIGIAQTFTFWSIVPPQGVFRGVSELVPGAVRRYHANGRVSESNVEGARNFDNGSNGDSDRSWPSRGSTGAPDRGARFEGTLDDAVAAVRAALDAATALRVSRADVPVGCYLSGGLDSSLIAAFGQRHARRAAHTFSLRFADNEFDETRFQRQMAARLDGEHHELEVSGADIAAVFPEVCWHAERPLLRTAPAPLFLLSRFVRSHGIKVVLTGEGADEMFAGYDLFREGKVRRFWARQPASAWRPRLLERLYPYLARSPVSQQAMARRFFGRNLARSLEPGFAHGTRWETTGALQRLFSPAMRDACAGYHAVEQFLASLPASLAQCSPLAQDQSIEIRTLLAGYLLASQGDRMLLGNSVEGRFPFLDPDVIALAHRLPDRFKLRGLDEKHVLKRAADGIVPAGIIARAKQPYRAPDAMAFVGDDAPDWIADALSPPAITAAGVFDPKAVQLLHSKCRARGPSGRFSNTDNMALVGILSTQLLHRQLIAN